MRCAARPRSADNPVNGTVRPSFCRRACAQRRSAPSLRRASAPDRRTRGPVRVDWAGGVGAGGAVVGRSLPTCPRVALRAIRPGSVGRTFGKRRCILSTAHANGEPRTRREEIRHEPFTEMQSFSIGSDRGLHRHADCRRCPPETCAARTEENACSDNVGGVASHERPRRRATVCRHAQSRLSSDHARSSRPLSTIMGARQVRKFGSTRADMNTGGHIDRPQTAVQRAVSQPNPRVLRGGTQLCPRLLGVPIRFSGDRGAGTVGTQHHSLPGGRHVPVYPPAAEHVLFGHRFYPQLDRREYAGTGCN